MQIDRTLHYVVRVSIAGRGLDFLLDSGASGILLDRDVARQLGLAEYGAYSTDANAGRYIGTHTIVPEMSVGPLKMKNVVVDTAPHVGADSTEVKVVGLLGFDFLDAISLKLDYANGTATAYDPAAFVAPSDPKTMTLDVRLGSGLPFVNVRINGVLGSRFALDTGGAGNMLIFDYFARQHPEAVVDADGRDNGLQRFRGVGGAFETKVIAVAKFTIGDETFDHLVANVVSTPHAYSGTMDGVIGPSLFNVFTFYADYPHRKIYFVPSAAALEASHQN